MNYSAHAGHRLVATVVAAAMLVSCAAPPGLSSTNAANRDDSSSPIIENASGMSAVAQTRTPCDEAARREQALGKAIGIALLGAALGAFLGKVIGDKLGGKGNQGAKVGALAGAFVGGKLGYDNATDTSRRQCDVWKTAQQQRVEQAFATLQVGRETAGEIIATSAEGNFFPGTATLTPNGVSYYKLVANQYSSQTQLRSYEQTVRSAATQTNKRELDELKAYTANAEDARRMNELWGRMRIMLTGHTDDQIEPLAAMRISEQRAVTVATLFRDNGINEATLLFQGAGSAFPVADNLTPEGRRLNNRVEIVVLYSEDAIAAYRDARQSDHRLFGHLPDSTPTAGPASASAGTTTSNSRPAAQTNQPSSTNVRKQEPSRNQREPKVAATKPAQKASVPAQETRTAATKASVRPPVAVSVPALELPGFDLGGEAWGQSAPTITAKLGRVQPQGISLAGLFGIGDANAERPPVANCFDDNPLRYQAGSIKRLTTGAIYTPTVKPTIGAGDAYLGIVRRSYGGEAGTYFVEVRGVTPRATGELAEPISFHLYEGYVGKVDAQKRDAKPDYSVGPTAFSIRGEGGVLVRQFFPHDRGLECMDFFIANRMDQRRVADGVITYRQGGERRVARLALSS